LFSFEAWQLSQIAWRLHSRVIDHRPNVCTSNCIKSCETPPLACLGIEPAWQLVENRVHASAGLRETIGVGEVATDYVGPKRNKVVSIRATSHEGADWQASGNELGTYSPADESTRTANQNRRIRHRVLLSLAEAKVAPSSNQL
jgi:hypothetical protein